MLVSSPPYSISPREEWKIRDGDIVTLLFVNGILIVIPIGISLLFADWTDTGDAIRDVVVFFTTGQLINPRHLFYPTGLLSLLVYFFFYYFYIQEYVTKIWNNFFVEAQDRRNLYLVSGLQLLSLLVACARPNYWYLNVIFFQMIVVATVYRRYFRLRRRLLEHGVQFQSDGPVIPKGDLEEALKREVTLLYLLRTGVSSTGIKGAMYGLPFLVLIGWCHIGRRWTGDQTDLLLVGMYVASSFLFVILSSTRYATRAAITIDRLRQRAEAGDRAYFDAMLR